MFGSHVNFILYLYWIRYLITGWPINITWPNLPLLKEKYPHHFPLRVEYHCINKMPLPSLTLNHHYPTHFIHVLPSSMSKPFKSPLHWFPPNLLLLCYFRVLLLPNIATIFQKFKGCIWYQLQIETLIWSLITTV